MTEADWLTATDPQPMLKFLRGRAGDRKLQLFAVACCRLVESFLMYDSGRAAVDTAERNADGLAGEDERQAALTALMREGSAESGPAGGVWQFREFDRRAEAIAEAVRLSMEAPEGRSRLGCSNVRAVIDRSLYGTPNNPGEGPPDDWRAAQAARLRDVLGNPFRPVTADPAWLTPGVVALARRMYDERDFSTMPILADALQDAGCEQADILAHCRGDGPHVRGCWVVDLVLGKK